SFHVACLQPSKGTPYRFTDTRERVLDGPCSGQTQMYGATVGEELPMIERRLKILILTYLWGTLLLDTGLFLMAWLAPDVWFRVFHGTAPASFDIALLRRSAGQWAAFALTQGIALWCWRKNPVWLVMVAGVRFSD